MVRWAQDKNALSKFKALYETQNGLIEYKALWVNSRLGQIESLVCKGRTWS